MDGEDLLAGCLRGRGASLAATLLVTLFGSAAGALAAPRKVTVTPQPMVATRPAAGHEFEGWFVLDKPPDPAVAGYAVPAGAAIRIIFPDTFTPIAGAHPEAVLLYGWLQKAIGVPLTVIRDSARPGSIRPDWGQDMRGLAFSALLCRPAT